MLRAELDRRSDQLKKIPKEQRPDGKVTRELAAQTRLGLRPIVATFDEVQNLFMHPEFGKQAAEDAAYVIRARPRLRHHPDPGHPAADVRVAADGGVAGTSTVRLCLKVPGHVENDIVLGTWRPQERLHGRRCSAPRPTPAWAG